MASGVKPGFDGELISRWRLCPECPRRCRRRSAPPREARLRFGPLTLATKARCRRSRRSKSLQEGDLRKPRWKPMGVVVERRVALTEVGSRTVLPAGAVVRQPPAGHRGPQGGRWVIPPHSLLEGHGAGTSSDSRPVVRLAGDRSNDVAERRLSFTCGSPRRGGAPLGLPRSRGDGPMRSARLRHETGEEKARADNCRPRAPPAPGGNRFSMSRTVVTPAAWCGTLPSGP
jgi:hypothetical protein